MNQMLDPLTIPQPMGVTTTSGGAGSFRPQPEASFQERQETKMSVEIHEGPAGCIPQGDGTFRREQSLIQVTRDDNGVIIETKKVGTKELPGLFKMGEPVYDENGNRDPSWNGPVIYDQATFVPHKLIEVKEEE